MTQTQRKEILEKQTEKIEAEKELVKEKKKLQIAITDAWSKFALKAAIALIAGLGVLVVVLRIILIFLNR